MRVDQLLTAIILKDYARAVLLILQAWKGTIKGKELYDQLFRYINTPAGM